MAQLFFPPVMQASDGSGNPYSGAKLYFYTTGTTTPITIYQDSGLITPHTNPVIADSSGQFAPIYLAETTYKIVLKSSLDVTIRTVDPVVMAVTASTGSGTFTTLSFTGALTSPWALVAQGRLTLESGVPISTTDQLAKGNLYYTPYVGNAISLYSGTAWVTRTFSEVTLALTLTSGKPYDIFAYDNAGSVALEPLVWTNDTTRATALVMQDGVLSKTGALTRRYIGSIYASGANQTQIKFGSSAASGGEAYFGIWNENNRVRASTNVRDSTASHAYTTATARGWAGAATMRASWMQGRVAESASAHFTAQTQAAAAGGVTRIGIGLDSTTVYTSPAVIGNVGAGVWSGNTTAPIGVQPAAGFHYLQAMETGDGANANLFFGGSLTALIAEVFY